MSTVIDFSAGVPSASAVRAAGHIGAVRYISPARESWQIGKPVKLPEKQDYDRNGLGMAFVWQYGKEVDADVKRGRDGGVKDAKQAQEQLKALGVPNAPVFFAVDFDISLAEWNSFGVEYFRGVNSVLGKQRTGIYGHSRVCHWAGPEDDVIAKVGSQRYLAWVTKAWSAGDTGRDYAVLYQRSFDSTKVDGVGVDISDVYSDNWGQKPLKEVRNAQVAQVKTNDNAVDVDLSYMIPFGGPTALPKRVIVVHTTENDLNGSAANVINYQKNSRTGSYHRLVDHTGKITLANTDDWQVWATKNKGNDIALHLSMVWWARTSREEWLGQPQMLNAAARVIAFWSRTYNIPLKKLTREQLAAGEHGVVGHLETQVWGGTDHTDPGSGFPFDVVLNMARQINSAPAPVVKAEQDFMEVFMSQAVRSLINPEKKFEPGALLGIIDATNWQTNKAIQGLYEALGMDYQGYIDACVDADRKGAKSPSITQFISK